MGSYISQPFLLWSTGWNEKELNGYWSNKPLLYKHSLYHWSVPRARTSKNGRGNISSDWELNAPISPWTMFTHLFLAEQRSREPNSVRCVWFVWQQAQWASCLPLMFFMNSSSFILRSALMFLLCRSVLSMMMANASRKMVSGFLKYFIWSGLQMQ